MNLKKLKPKPRVPVRPANVFTTREYAEAQGISKDRALTRLAALVKEGTIRAYLNLEVLSADEKIQRTSGWELVNGD